MANVKIKVDPQETKGVKLNTTATAMTINAVGDIGETQILAISFDINVDQWSVTIDAQKNVKRFVSACRTYGAITNLRAYAMYPSATVDKQLKIKYLNNDAPRVVNGEYSIEGNTIELTFPTDGTVEMYGTYTAFVEV